MALSPCIVQIDSHGRELLQHGTTAFPIACYHDDLTRSEVPWHWHEELELIYVSEGQSLVAAGSQKHVLSQGWGMLINSQVLHACWNHDSNTCHYHSIVFHPRLVGGSVDSIFWQNYIQPLISDPSLECICFQPDIPWHKESLDALEQSWQLCAKELDGYEFQVRNHLSHLIYLLSSHQTTAQSPPSERLLREGERIKTMLQYVHDNYTDEISVAQIAACASVSVSECLRCFRNMIGRTPMQYVREYRLQQAYELLTSGDYKVSEAGLMCGFQEMGYFARVFREKFGVKPSEMRGARKGDAQG